jgi:two-component sensor histidine kinase
MIGLEQRDGEVVLAIEDDGPGLLNGTDGTGLSIVRALVQDELGGVLTFDQEPGLRATVVFPA